jgi:hypothetical protein
MAGLLTRALTLPASNQDFFGDGNGTLFEAYINALAQAASPLVASRVLTVLTEQSDETRWPPSSPAPSTSSSPIHHRLRHGSRLRPSSTGHHSRHPQRRQRASPVHRHRDPERGELCFDEATQRVSFSIVNSPILRSASNRRRSPSASSHLIR